MTSQRKPVGRPPKQQAISATENAYDELIAEWTTPSKNYDTGLPEFIPFRPKHTPLKDSTLPIVMQRKNSILDRIICQEPIEPARIDKAIFSNAVNQLCVHYNSRATYGNLRTQLIALKDNIKKGKLVVEYNIGAHGYGRANPKACLSLGSLTRPLRHALLKDEWVDIDICNAQVEMLRQICEANKWKAESLTRYCQNRDAYFAAVAKAFKFQDGTGLDVKKDRDVIKRLFICFIFYGGFERWKNDSGIHKDCKQSDCRQIDEFKNELNCLGKDFLFHNEAFVNKVNSDIRAKTHTDNSGTTLEYTNPIGRAMSLLLQDWERRSLEAMYSYFVKCGAIKDAEVILCFDGLMVRKSAFDPEMMQGLPAYVYDKVGFQLDFATKPMTEGEALSETLRFQYVTDEKALAAFNKDVFDELQTYDEKKVYFERFFCRIMQPDMVHEYYFNAVEGDKRDCRSFSYNCKSEFGSAFRHLLYNSWSDPQQPKLTAEKFAPRWLDDADAKVSKTIEFEPENSSEMDMLNKPWSRGDYRCNLFTGYSDKIHTRITKADNESLEMWLQIATHLCEGNDNHRDYLLKVFAMKIREPTTNIPIGIVLKGPSGSGKSLLIETIGRILGKRHYIISSKPNDFFGDYAEGFCNKLLVNMNEIEGRDTIDFQGRIKEFITEESITVNPKFIRGYSIKNYALLIVTSNKPNPVSIDVLSRDRRWVVFDSTDKFVKMSKDHWQVVRERFNQPSFTAKLYSYLMSLDISGFNPSGERPQTQGYKEMTEKGIPPFVMWLEELYRADLQASKEALSTFQKKQRTALGTEMYKNFQKYKEEFGFNHADYSIKKFYSELRSFEQRGCNISVQKKMDGNNICFTYDGIFRVLQAQKLTTIFDDEPLKKALPRAEPSLEECFGMRPVSPTIKKMIALGIKLPATEISTIDPLRQEADF